MSALDKLFGRGNVTYHIAVAEALDSVAAAIFAEQIAFWQAWSEDGWAFRTVEEIREYTGLKKDAQQGARKRLEKIEVLQVKTEGMPRRNYYRLDTERLVQLVEGLPPTMGGTPSAMGGNPPTDAQNPPPSGREPANRSIEGVKSEELESSEDAPSGAEPDEEGKVLPFNKWLTDMFYKGVKKDHGVTLEPGRFSFHLGRFKTMVEKYNPEVAEAERVVQHMVRVFPQRPNIDAMQGMEDVKTGRDTGEAWEGPPPWEKAKQDREQVNPHSDRGEEAKDKPYGAVWYASAYGLTTEQIETLLKEHDSHADLVTAIERGDF